MFIAEMFSSQSLQDKSQVFGFKSLAKKKEVITWNVCFVVLKLLIMTQLMQNPL